MFQGSPRGFTEEVMCAGPGGRFIGGSIVTGKAGTDTGQEQMPIAFTFFFPPSLKNCIHYNEAMIF